MKLCPPMLCWAVVTLWALAEVAAATQTLRTCKSVEACTQLCLCGPMIYQDGVSACDSVLKTRQTPHVLAFPQRISLGLDSTLHTIFAAVPKLRWGPLDF